MTATEARALLAPYARHLGRLSDREIATLSGLSVYRVRTARERKGIGKAPKTGRPVVHKPHQCSRCGSVGHNRRTCGAS